MKKEEKSIKTGPQYRSLAILRGEVDEEKRTVPLSFSSETEEVERWFGIEILDHSPGAVRLGRLNNKGAFMDRHHGDQIGVIENAEIGADRKGRAVVRFGKGARAEELFRDVLDGIRTKVSCGYINHKMVLEEEGDNTPSKYRVTDWEPYEISMEPVPFDDSVGIGRNKESETETTIERGHVMNDENNGEEQRAASVPKPAQIDVTGIKKQAREDARKEELARCREIQEIGDKHNLRDLARKFTQEGGTVDAFRCAVLEEVGNATPIALPNPKIGLSDKEVRKYSLVSAIRQLGNSQPLEGLEREASDAVAKMCGRAAKGFYIPQDIMAEKRDLSAGDATKGGYTVGTDVLGSSMIELLRNKTVVSQLGAKTLTGLVGNIAIPRITGGATAYWLPENGEVTASDQSFGQLGLTPHRLVGDTAYSKELMMQSSIQVEAFVRDDLMRILAIEKDRAAINGLGANGEPTGIMNTTGVKTVTFGAAPTWAKVVDFETQIADANADVGQMAYITGPTVRGKWKTTVKVTNQAVFLWEENKVNGYRAESTKQVPSNKVIFGNWADFIMAEWAGIDIVIDPYSLKKKGQVEVTITLHCDMGARHAVSFCVSTDSGAQ